MEWRIKVALLMLGFLTLANHAYAYIDPGIAGILYQVGYVAVIGVVGWFGGLKYVLRRFLKRKEESQSE